MEPITVFDAEIATYVVEHKEDFIRVSSTDVLSRSCLVCGRYVDRYDASYINSDIGRYVRVCVPCWNYVFGIDRQISVAIDKFADEIDASKLVDMLDAILLSDHSGDEIWLTPEGFDTVGKIRDMLVNIGLLRATT